MATTPVVHYSDTQVEITKTIVGPYDNNVFVVRCRETGDAMLIDAANEHEMLLELCRALGVRKVVETHGHWDHIQAVTQIRDAGYSVAVTQADAAMLPSYDEILEDDEVLTIGRLRLRTIATPGHTPGSICFHLEGSPVLFSGDTLFPGGPGATRFEGSSFPRIIESIDVDCSPSRRTPSCCRAMASTPPSLPSNRGCSRGSTGDGDWANLRPPRLPSATNSQHADDEPPPAILDAALVAHPPSSLPTRRTPGSS